MKLSGHLTVLVAVVVGAASCSSDAEPDDPEPAAVEEEQLDAEQAVVLDRAAEVCEAIERAPGSLDAILAGRVAGIVNTGVDEDDLRAAIDDECGELILAIEEEEEEEEVEPQPEPEAEPEPTIEELPEDVQLLILEADINDDGEFRSAFIDVLDATGVESVDFLGFDMETETLRVAVTSRYRTERNVADDAWALVRIIAQTPIYSDTWIAVLGVSMDLEVSDQAWSCPGDLMLDLASARASRSDWEAACSP